MVHNSRNHVKHFFEIMYHTVSVTITRGPLRLTIPSDRLTTTTTNTSHIALPLRASLTNTTTSTLRLLSVRHKLPALTRSLPLLTISRLTFTRGQLAPSLLRQIPRRPTSTTSRLPIRSRPLLTSPPRQRPLTLRLPPTITATSLAIRLSQQLSLPSRPLTSTTPLVTSHNATLQPLTQLRLRVVHPLQMDTTRNEHLSSSLTPSKRTTSRITNTGLKRVILDLNTVNIHTIIHNTHCPTPEHLYDEHLYDTQYPQGYPQPVDNHDQTNTCSSRAESPEKLFGSARRCWGEPCQIFYPMSFWLDLSERLLLCLRQYSRLYSVRGGRFLLLFRRHSRQRRWFGLEGWR